MSDAKIYKLVNTVDDACKTVHGMDSRFERKRLMHNGEIKPTRQMTRRDIHNALEKIPKNCHENFPKKCCPENFPKIFFSC